MTIFESATVLGTTPASLATGTDLGTGVVLMVVGMGVVFVALTVLMGVVALLRRVFDPAAPVAVVPAAPAVEDGVAPEIVAVLSAAAVAAMGAPVRITRVKRAEGGAAWASQGRGRLMDRGRPSRG